MTKALLPNEIWINVFSFVPCTNTSAFNTRKDLTTCRLVCKQWSALAERAMFALPLHVHNDEKFINKLLYHLTRKPTLARLIKKIELPIAFDTENLQYRELLKAIITSEIEEIKGSCMEDSFYELLLEIIESAQGLRKLKRLPKPNGQSDVYLKAAYACKDALVNLIIENADNYGEVYLQHLHEFRQLKKIRLSLQDMADIGAIDQLLQKLVCINHIKGSIEVGGNYVVKSQHEMTRWLAQNVEKDENLRCLGYENLCFKAYECNLVEYFLYKYPKLETLSLKIMDFNNYSRNSQNPLELILAEDIPTLRITGRCYMPEDLRMIGSLLKSRSNTVKMVYQPFCEEDCDMGLSRLDTDHTVFDIQVAPEWEHSYFEHFLSSICTEDSHITKLNIDLVHYRESFTGRILTLYDILQWTPHVQQLHFSDETIKYQEQSPGTLVFNDLKTLTFYDAEIQDSVITQLGNAASKLEEFKLSTCAILNAEDEFEGHYYISLPQNTLKKIEILVPASSNVECMTEEDFDLPNMQKLRTICDQINVARDMYLLIRMGQSSEDQYFLLPWKGKDNILIATKEEYDLHSPGATVIQIACKALSELKLNTPHFDVQLRWKDGELDEEASYPVSEFFKLKKENSALKELLASKEQSSPKVDRMEVDSNTL